VEKEWSVDIDRDRSSIYEPRVDVAVGPFAIEGQQDRDYYQNKLDHLAETILPDLVRKTNDNYEEFQNFCGTWNTEGKLLQLANVRTLNQNPRCFLSVEVEANDAGKYMLGNIVNTISLGKIGVIIPASDSSKRSVFRCLEYLQFLDNVGKPTFPTKCLVLTKEQFKSVF
jgi:hypothetical protein